MKYLDGRNKALRGKSVGAETRIMSVLPENWGYIPGLGPT
jgi:hypothetical protein